MSRIAALLTCHNRRNSTVAAVGALAAQSTDAVIDLVLHDDGSTDGTADAVRGIWPEAMILQGDGKRYWCGGMRAAWQAALDQTHDHFLWVNDDTMLDPDAVAVLVSTHRAHPRAVIVGSSSGRQR